MVKIGYPGEAYSDSELMARELATKSMLRSPEFGRYGSVADVVAAMESKQIDYGVFPFRDSVEGDMAETAAATDGRHCLILGTAWCLMPRSVFVSSGSPVTEVRGDRKSLDMCQNSISALYPGAVLKVCARPEEGLPEGCAAVCRKEAGEAAGLTMAADDVRDDTLLMVQYMIAKLV